MSVQSNQELRDQFKIKFEGDKSQIDANTLVNYLIHLNTVIQEINKEVEPTRKISIKINALSKGSFLIEIELLSILQTLSQLFTKDRVEYLAGIFGIYQGLITLKGSLKGEKPADVKSDGGTVTIRSNYGDVIQVSNITYNIYTKNPTANEAITKQFETLDADENIEGLEILDKRQRAIVTLKKEDFDDLTHRNEVIELEAEHAVKDEVKDGAILSIVKLSFDPKLKSDFYYHGLKITAYIKDKSFYDKVDSGQQFAKGDALEVRLKVNRSYDESVDVDVIKGYEVLEVVRHIPRSDKNQLKIDLSGMK